MSYDMPIAVCPEFRVLYEDEGVLVVDKAAPLLTHPRARTPSTHCGSTFCFKTVPSGQFVVSEGSLWLLVWMGS